MLNTYCMNERVAERKKCREKKYRIESKRRYEVTVVVDKAVLLSQDLKSSPHKHLQVRGIYSRWFFFHTYIFSVYIYIYSSSILSIVIFLLLCFSLTFCLLSRSLNTHTVSLFPSISMYPCCSPSVIVIAERNQMR